MKPVELKHRPRRGLPGGRLASVLPLLAVLLLWELVVRGFAIPPYYLPPLSAVLLELGRELMTGSVLVQTAHTMLRSLAGIVLGVLAGVGLGVAFGWYRWLEQAMDPLIAATYPLPKIALIPLLIVWLGIGEAPVVVMAFIGAVYPILINTIAGVKTVDAVLVKAARDLGANDGQLFREVILPGSLPMVFAGLKIGAGVALILVVAAEMLSGQSGVGFQIREAASILRLDQVFAGLVVLAAMGVLLFEMVDRLQRWAIPWHASSKSDEGAT
jgi:NitT/TauT family transport system permease protein